MKFLAHLVGFPGRIGDEQLSVWAPGSLLPTLLLLISCCPILQEQRRCLIENAHRRVNLRLNMELDLQS
jgi:hypothetical protein